MCTPKTQKTATTEQLQENNSFYPYPFKPLNIPAFTEQRLFNFNRATNRQRYNSANTYAQ